MPENKNGENGREESRGSFVFFEANEALINIAVLLKNIIPLIPQTKLR